MTTAVQPTRPLPRARSARPAAQPATRIHDWAQASTRMLVATFFIATAASNTGESAFHIGTLGPQQTELMFNAMIYGMAFAVLVGRFLHVAALVLALVLLTSSIIEIETGLKDLDAFWRDLAISGALFMMAVSRGGTMMPSLARRQANAAQVRPRRPVVLAPDSPTIDHPQGRGRMQVARPIAMPVFKSVRSA